MDTAQERFTVRAVGPAGLDVPREAGRAYTSCHAGQRKQASQLACEKESALPGIVQRFYSERIAGQKQLPLQCIQNCESKHPLKPEEALFAPSFVRPEQNLGVARGNKAVSLRFEFSPKFAVIVNFPVIDQNVAALGVHQGLVSRVREIEDCEARSAQSDSGGIRDRLSGPDRAQ